MEAVGSRPPGPGGGFWTLRRREELEFYLCVSPWIVGFVLFTAGPMIASLGISLADWKLIAPPFWVGLQNYRDIFTDDDLFVKALVNTAYYTGASVPLRLVVAFAVASLLNVKIPGQPFFRTVFFLPSILSGVAVAIVFIWIFDPNYGILNQALALARIRGPQWLTDPNWAMPALILQGLWGGIGGLMVIYLAGLQGIPQHLYEAAEVDGADRWARLRHITVPLMSPVIFFTLVLGVVGSFQVFTSSFVMTRGGPNYATFTYVLYLYAKAFEQFKMGYAAALAWVLFLLIVALTYLQFRLGRRWVYYEAPTDGRR
ncbi:MAG TPA: sugar ABC transporter permease [Chloroflexota bacterium]|jgi:multiple sugar transport system permease protein